MTSAGTTLWRGKTIGERVVGHRDSHAELLCDLSGAPVPALQSRPGRPDVIVVPATRPASALAGVIRLAADTDAQLVVLCSRQAKVDEVAKQVERIAGARGLVVRFHHNYVLPRSQL